MTSPLGFKPAHFKPLMDVLESDSCIICYGTPSNPVSHIVGAVAKVHHVACASCLTQWAQVCVDEDRVPCCPLTTLMLSEQTLMHVCSIVLESSFQERTDCILLQLRQLFNSINSKGKRCILPPNFSKEADELNKELGCFLLTLRVYTIRHFNDPSFRETVSRFLTNLIRGINRKKQKKALKWSSTFSPDNLIAKTKIGNLVETISKSQDDLEKDYDNFAQRQIVSQRYNVCGSLVFLILTYASLQYVDRSDETKEKDPYFDLMAVILSCAVSICAYMGFKHLAPRFDVEDMIEGVIALKIN
jgi:hypothetical protein